MEDKILAAQKREAGQKIYETNVAIAQILGAPEPSGQAKAASEKGAAFSTERITRSLVQYCGPQAGEPDMLVIEALLAQPKCDVNRAAEGGPPLLVAARAGREPVVRLLLAKGADPDRPFEGEAPLHAAVRSAPPALLDALLDAGAALAAESAEGLQPLHVAAKLGRAEAVAALARRAGQGGGAGPSGGPGPGALDARTREGRTALSLALEAGSLACVQALLEAGADPNAADACGEGNSPLHWAVARGAREAAEALLRAAASLEARNAAGHTPLEMTDSDKLRSALKQAAEAAARDGPVKAAGSSRHSAGQRVELVVVHGGEHAEAARRLAGRLRAAGRAVGVEGEGELEAASAVAGAVEACGAVVALVSARSSAATPFRDLLALAENRSRRLLPVLLPDFDLPPALAASLRGAAPIAWAEDEWLAAASTKLLAATAAPPAPAAR